jgi:2',3'-cyclic-nucleotide 2'-phosphodiesterase (5'-nucleotidase family)
VGHIPGETDSTRRARGDVARLARGIPGVDAWLGGHSHNVIDDRIEGASVMIAGSHGQWLAVVDMIVDPVKRTVIEKRQRMIQVLEGDAPVDSAWHGRVERWNAGIAPIAAEVLGRATAALDRRRPEATIGNFITEAMRFVSGAEIAMQNPGGMRANLAPGEITRGAVYEVMPFDNTIVTESLTADEVKLALEQGLRNDRVTQVSGIKYVIDMSRPAGDRVTSLALADGSPLDPQKLYKVAVNNFMATGGDNFDVLANGRDKTDTALLIRGAMEALVRDRCKGGGALDIRVDGRITEAGRR